MSDSLEMMCEIYDFQYCTLLRTLFYDKFSLIYETVLKEYTHPVCSILQLDILVSFLSFCYKFTLP